MRARVAAAGVAESAGAVGNEATQVVDTSQILFASIPQANRGTVAPRQIVDVAAPVGFESVSAPRGYWELQSVPYSGQVLLKRALLHRICIPRQWCISSTCRKDSSVCSIAVTGAA